MTIRLYVSKQPNFAIWQPPLLPDHAAMSYLPLLQNVTSFVDQTNSGAAVNQTARRPLLILGANTPMSAPTDAPTQTTMETVIATWTTTSRAAVSVLVRDKQIRFYLSTYEDHRKPIDPKPRRLIQLVRCFYCVAFTNEKYMAIGDDISTHLVQLISIEGGTSNSQSCGC